MGNEPIKSFEDLKCWQACRDLRLFVSKSVIPLLPIDERFGLISQIRNSSRSTTTNIAEGYGRFHHLDNAKFCSNSRGSCWEALDHLITAHDENYIDDSLLNSGRDLTNEAIRTLNGYNRLSEKSCSNLTLWAPHENRQPITDN